MGTICVEREIACKSEPAALWCVVADTERLNRSVGLGALELVPNDDDSAARYLVKTTSGGFPLEYEERPFEWVENERFSVRRVMRGGVAAWMQNTFSLAPREGGGSTLGVRIEMEPRIGLLAPIMKLQVRRFIERILREMSKVDAELAAGRAARLPPGTTRVDELALERAATALRGELGEERREVGDRLVAFVRDAGDADVGRIRPFELADRWGVERRVALEVCLAATVAGLLELTWDIVCPSCRTTAGRMQTLSEVGTSGHCQLCDISFELELDRAVEATFRPARGVRLVDEGPYCIGGPQRTPHVVAQALLPAGGTSTLPAPRTPGRYRIFVRGGSVAALSVVADHAGGATLRIDGENVSPATLEVAPGASIVFEQAAGAERHVKIERLEYASLAATAHEVSTLPMFRRRFASETLRPGITLNVARVALLFTDLTDSTALYSSVGDAKAFKVVQEHFDLLRAIIERESGVIVKTIGDAVMASFVEERDALRAALAMHRAFPGFRAGIEEAGATFLKIGVYAGPCYVVTANGVLDYFGQSVNLAARLQGAAKGGEIVVCEELADEALERGWLEGVEVGDRFDAQLKGLDHPVRAARIHVDR